MQIEISDSPRPQIVILGGGFAGLSVAQDLADLEADVTVIDRNNHHLFQPLLYQVVTASLSPSEISYPIRSALRDQSNAHTIRAEVLGIDRKKNQVLIEDRKIPYDVLVVATGSKPKSDRGLKTVTDATQLRRQIMLAFEKAEIETDPVKQQTLMTFVIVGGGATGVELAGSMAELVREMRPGDFRRIHPGWRRIILVEAQDRVLPEFPPALSQKAHAQLTELGVEVRTRSRVFHWDEHAIFIGPERIAAQIFTWTTGVVASPAGKWLGAETDREGRVLVANNLMLPSCDEDQPIFVIGDTAAIRDENNKPLPSGIATSIQQGRHVAQSIRKLLKQQPDAFSPFQFQDQRHLVRIGKTNAVADLGSVQFTGLLGWCTWFLAHLSSLIGFKNRPLILMRWTFRSLMLRRGL